MKNSRRDFIKKTALGGTAIAVGNSAMGMSAKSYRKIIGSNDRIHVAIAGLGRRLGAYFDPIARKESNVELMYLCDVMESQRVNALKSFSEHIDYKPKLENDIRKVLEDSKVDALINATPDHWHTPGSIMAMKAGKHVYVEKPSSHNMFENELLVEATKKYGKVVQMGNQQRSAITSINAINDIRNGIIGKVYKGEAYYSNNRGSIGKGKITPIPKSLDWDLWQGPAARTQYKDNIHPYNWHWFRRWGTGEVHNNGTHEIDICRWALGVDLPESVTSFGGKYAYQDDWEFVDNQQVTFKYPEEKFITWTGHSRGLIKPKQPGRGVTIYGSKGTIQLDRNFCKYYDLGGNLIKSELEGVISKTTDTKGQGGLDVNHIGNLFDAIREEKLLTAEIKDASISTFLCHLANMAQDAGETLKIDQKTGKILNNTKIMHNWKREYAKGWEPKI